MAKSIVKLIEEVIGRRTFMQKVMTVTGAFMTGLLGAPRLAYACNGCCGLCVDPSTCTFDASKCDCVWCWTCADKINCLTWRCKECLKAPFPAGCTKDGANPTCRCWGSNHVDPCRYCRSDIPCSSAEMLGRIVGCIPK